ncbi:hypothetical protein [Stakelama tenebrarum]|uniref:Lipoprotein n=1 Tax=Stakelama tenebrarum TaxID=2711215 RepID=A0A6G6Y8U8_9SPHN|nr:hypothetical protein [Sphingosinithalassobacter tenebrarum]QIG81271.1 hypothetical protein G5C33_16780 [Sphingosinithalassobacter tenebrarum]
MTGRALGSLVIASLVAAGCIYIVATPQPQLPVETVNGTYHNACCGDWTFHDGRLTIDGQDISYVIEKDKSGVAIHPSAYVGASERGSVIQRNRSPSLLRPIGDPPDAIWVHGFGKAADYRFDRIEKE